MTKNILKMRRTIVNAIMSILTSTILLILAWRSAQLPSLDEHKCKNLMKSGRWSQKYDPEAKDVRWQPYGCQLQLYDERSTTRCLSDRPVYFIGDSTVRQVFWAVAHKLGREEAKAGSESSPKHTDLVFQHKNVTLKYRWDPYLNKTDTILLLPHSANSDEYNQLNSINTMHNHPNEDNFVKIIGSGLWYARYLDQDFAIEYEKTMDKLAGSSPWPHLKDTAARASTFMIPPPVLDYARLDVDRAQTLTVARMSKLLHIMNSTEQSLSIEVAWVMRAMTEDNTHGIMTNGLHVTAELAGHQADVILNKICNQKVFNNTNKASSLCCVEEKYWHLPASIFMSIMAASNFVCHFWICAGKECHIHYAIIQAILQITVVVSYCWIADRTTLFEKSNKIVQEDIFKYFMAIAAILGMLRISFSPRSSESKTGSSSVSRRLFQTDVHVLARSQTEEWKGWMQVYLLLYHYFGMSKVLWAYQIARVLVASYIFLTGYGHATYFQKTRDCSSRRVVIVLLRLNLLSCILAAVMNNKYEFYYFPELASLWFLITFAIFRTRSDKDLPTRTLTVRIMVAICMIQTVLTLERPLSMVARILQVIYGPRINVKELCFRVKLDAYSAFFGMFISIVQHRCARWTCKMNCEYYVLKQLNTFRSTITFAASVGILWVYVLIARRFPNKFAYNKYHPVISILPIASYVMARNACQRMRKCSLPIFASIGTYSLELFVLQYHIWLAADTKGLLRLGLLDRLKNSSARPVSGSWNFWFETIIVALTFFWLSKHCAHATNTIVQWIAGEGKQPSSSEWRWPLPESRPGQIPGDLEAGRYFQYRGINICIIMLAILWLVNIIYD